MADSRQCLFHDWTQGDYIDGGTLEGRIDWQALEEMEQHAMGLIEEVFDRFETVIIGWSGGIDSVVILKLAEKLGLTDLLAVAILNHNYHWCIQNYVEAFPPTLGFEVETDYSPRNMEWVVENADRAVYPDWDDKQWLLDTGYRRHVRKYNNDHDIDAFLSGLRNEVNTTNEHVTHQRGAYQVSPIRTWTTEHVVAFCDKYDLLLSPFYFEFPTTGGYPWYRRRTHDRYGNRIRTREQYWYWTRRICLRAGYTDFWKHITDHFPEGEDLALDHAAASNLPVLDIEEGYDYGCDPVYSVLDAERNLSDFQTETLIAPDK